MKEKTHSENVAELFRANLDASVDVDFERIAADLAKATPGAIRATRALQKENGRRLLAVPREEFLTQEEIAQFIDRETGLAALVRAVEAANDLFARMDDKEDRVTPAQFEAAWSLQQDALNAANGDA